ncbi:adenylate/guanylate cyclase domain-containing protein [Flavisolibacter ginsenosidimutans]|nr:adenylate/guanylate cyclase domain-containing protein [Flavisolibacter ginsenosidimutans]
MEENIAVLMADLSGYTALTETHGAVSAADLIDKYLEIVQGCLVGDCKLIERTGDEVMIVSASSDFLLSTAVMIMTNASRQENFLQVHGGLHYGKVLKRNGSYFGSVINLTSRIAAKATPGNFWCSEDFLLAVSDKSAFTFEPKGKHRFKNISDDMEIAALVNTSAEAFVVDPVCRMLILDKTAAIQHPETPVFIFVRRLASVVLRPQRRPVLRLPSRFLNLPKP